MLVPLKRPQSRVRFTALDDKVQVKIQRELRQRTFFRMITNFKEAFKKIKNDLKDWDYLAKDIQNPANLKKFQNAQNKALATAEQLEKIIDNWHDVTSQIFRNEEK